MNKNARLDQLLDLLGLEKDHRAHLQARQAKLALHHEGRERDRTVRKNDRELRRIEKAIRTLERAIHNTKKQKSPVHQPVT